MQGGVPDFDSGADGYDRVEYFYNLQGQVCYMRNQNQTVHEYVFDGLGRETADCVLLPGSGIDATVLRIERSYEVRGLLERVTSYDSPTPGEGTVLNQVLMTYNDFGQLTGDYQEHIGAKDGSTLYVGYTYDSAANGLRLLSVRYPNYPNPGGRAVGYDYDNVGLEDIHAHVLNRPYAIAGVKYTYLGLGTIVKEDYTQPKVKLDYIGTGTYGGFDDFGRVVDQVWKKYNGQTTVLDEFGYGHDFAGNRLWRENLKAGNSGDTKRY